MGDQKSRAELYYDRHASSYSPRDFSPDDIRNGLYFADQITWHFLKKYAPRRRSSLILDAGAGTGDWARQFAKLGYRNFVLADISEQMLKVAKRRSASIRGVNVRFVRSDISNMKEFHSGTFDYVYSQYDAVSLCLKPREAVSELARVAKKGAYIVVSLDIKYGTIPWLIEQRKLGQAVRLLRTNLAWYDHDYPTYSLTWEELGRYFEQAGLKITEVIGAEVFTNKVRKSVLDKLKADPRSRKVLLAMEFAHCTDRSLVNMAGHLQMVGQKS